MHRRITGQLVIATHNPGKLAEMRELLEPHGVEAISAGELGLGEPEETGETFAPTRDSRPVAAAKAAKLPAFADDSVSSSDALDGAPGIWSARWAARTRISAPRLNTDRAPVQERGATTPDKRSAHFVSALCVAWPDDHLEKSRPAPTAPWSGARPARTEGLATIRPFSPTGIRVPLAR